MKKILVMLMFTFLLVGCSQNSEEITPLSFVEDNEDYQTDKIVTFNQYFNGYRVDVDGTVKMLLENTGTNQYQVSFACGSEIITANSNEDYLFIDLGICETEVVKVVVNNITSEEVMTQQISMLYYTYSGEELESMYSYVDFEYINSYEEIPNQEGRYFVYVYLDNCAACKDIKYGLLDMMKDRDDFYLVNTAAATMNSSNMNQFSDDTETYLITSVPTLIVVEDGSVIDYIVGSLEIRDYIHEE